MALEHGGRMKTAARQYGIPEEEWLDLSTGISPWSWPLPSVPASVWRRLPEEDDELLPAARAWLSLNQEAACVALPGSQAAIQALPRMRSPSRVGVVHPGYAEHAHCWRAAGHVVHPLSVDDIPESLPQLDVLVWIQPNNPSGSFLSRETLLTYCDQLAARGGWLIVDEAFVEASDAPSLSAEAGRPGLLVLRSVGKFFGLAGLRAGFLLGTATVCDDLVDWIGPWAVSGPARWIVTQALRDQAWQQSQKRRLDKASNDLKALLKDRGMAYVGGTGLFQTVEHPDPRGFQSQLARSGIWVRAFDGKCLLRFGLPGDDGSLERLREALL